MKTNKMVIVLISVVILMCSLVGCSSKTAIDADTFVKTMYAENFTVTDVTNEIEANGLVTSLLVASNENYEIEFYVLTDNNTAASIFHNSKESYDDEYSVRTTSLSVTLGNYSYYAFVADGGFHMIARIDNTMLWCDADKAYKDEIIALVEKLGYK